MSLPTSTGARFLSVVFFGMLPLLPTHPVRAAEAETVELPPMIVEEKAESVRWLYASDGTTEFLSRCSLSTTRRYAEAWIRKLQLLRTLVPPAFLAKTDVPTVMVLYAQDLKQPVSAEIQRQLRTLQAEQATLPSADRPGRVHVGFAPNLRLNDRDMHASFVYIDEARFDAKTLIVAPNYLRFLLERRAPLLPGWLIEGIDRTYRNADLVKAPISFPPFIWTQRWDSEALIRDPQSSRALLPAGELFSPLVLGREADRHPRRVEIFLAQVELFIRWAVDSGGPNREALWKLAARAAEEPMTEEMFEACFGFGFSELRDRLSDYLPRAVQESPRVDPGSLTSPRLEVRPATPSEVARLRGEWERLAIGHVRRSLPEVRELYAEQARRTLRKAYDAGERDPRLLATMGLCEIDAGNEAGAREFLEPAVNAGVVRPRAYLEVARLRLADLRRGHPPERLFTYAELAPVFDPLRQAAKQAPPLPEVFMLMAEAWVRCVAAPDREDIALLELGEKYFARRPLVGFSLALFHLRYGKRDRAEALLATGEDYLDDEATRTRFTELRAFLADPKNGKR